MKAFLARCLALGLGGVAICLGGCLDAAPQMLPDDAGAQASQRRFSVAWREHYNRGEVAECGAAYLEDAALHVDLGPLAEEYRAAAGWSSPVVARGRANITKFWKASVRERLFVNLHACEDSGDTTCTAFVVDNDTIIVEGKFASDKASGRMLSETWVRRGAAWRLQSAMWEVEGVGSPVAVAVEELQSAMQAASTEASRRGEEEGGLQTSNATDATTDAAALSEAEAEEPPTRTKNGRVLLGALVVLWGGIVALLVRRHNQRKLPIVNFEAYEEARLHMAGFEAMIG